MFTFRYGIISVLPRGPLIIHLTCPDFPLYVFQSLTQADRDRLKDEFMNEFDENRDGRIEMHEVRICDFSKKIYIFF